MVRSLRKQAENQTYNFPSSVYKQLNLLITISYRLFKFTMQCFYPLFHIKNKNKLTIECQRQLSLALMKVLSSIFSLYAASNYTINSIFHLSVSFSLRPSVHDSLCSDTEITWSFVGHKRG